MALLILVMHFHPAKGESKNTYPRNLAMTLETNTCSTVCKKTVGAKVTSREHESGLPITLNGTRLLP